MCFGQLTCTSSRNKMAQPHLLFFALCGVLVILLVRGEDTCMKRKPRSQCSEIEIETWCFRIKDPSACPARTTFIPGGGMCDCDICAEFVEKGEICNVPSLPMPTCRNPYKCSTRNVCVSNCSVVG